MKASEIARQTIEPLCETTAEILKPIRLQPNDRLVISMNNDASRFIVRAYAELNGMQVRASGNANSGWLTFMPDKKELDDGSWSLPATDTTALLIEANWPREQLKFSPTAERFYLFLLLRFVSQTVQSRQRALFHIKGQAPEATKFEAPNLPAAPHQRVAFETTLGTEGSGLWMEQGTGKTYPTIMRIMAEAEKCDTMYRAIVVCPKNVRRNWELEVERFATVAGKITVLRGGHLERMKLMIDAMSVEDDCKYTIVVCGYETLTNSIDILGNIPWHIAIADESHAFKDHRIKRWKAMQKLRDAASSRVSLTGTPMCNNLFDCWTQLEWLGQGLSGFQSYNAFKLFYGKWERRSGHDEVVGYDNLPLLKERLSRLCFQVKKKDVLKDLPEKQFQTIEINLTADQVRAYKQLQEQLILEIENEKGSRTVSANNVLVKLLRLTQITSGFLAYDQQVDPDGNVVNAREVEMFSPNPKLEQLKEDVAALGEKSKGIIWCNNPCIIKEMVKFIPNAVVYYGAISDKERDEAVWKFNNDPECRWFIGNPSCCKEGLTLLGYSPDNDQGFNCDTVIRFNCDWSLVKYLQSNDRCHRRGTRVPITYKSYIVLNSIDDEIAARVNEKAQQAEDWQDIKAIMERVLTIVPDADE